MNKKKVLMQKTNEAIKKKRKSWDFLKLRELPRNAIADKSKKTDSNFWSPLRLNLLTGWFMIFCALIASPYSPYLHLGDVLPDDEPKEASFDAKANYYKGEELCFEGKSAKEILSIADTYFYKNDIERVRFCYASSAVSDDNEAYRISQANLGYMYYYGTYCEKDNIKALGYYENAYNCGMMRILPIILKLQLLLGYYDEAIGTIYEAYSNKDVTITTWLGWVMNNTSEETVCNASMSEFCESMRRDEQLAVLEHATYLTEWETSQETSSYLEGTSSTLTETRRVLYEKVTGGFLTEKRVRNQLLRFGEMLEAKIQYFSVEDYM